jgi:hypothetical protein
MRAVARDHLDNGRLSRILMVQGNIYARIHIGEYS